MPRRTGITTETVKRFIIDAGALYINYGLTGERMVGATQGGNTFVIENEIKEIEIDGAKGLIRGARRVTGVTARITSNLIEMTSDNFQLAIAGSTSTEGMEDGTAPATAGTGTHSIIKRTREIGDMDFIDNVAIVGTINGSNDPIIVLIENALADGDFEVGQEDKEEAVLEVQFTAHFSPEDVNENTEPWEIRFPNAG